MIDDTGNMRNIPINYPPNFKVRYGYGSEPNKYILDIFEYHSETQLAFINILKKYRQYFDEIALSEDETSQEPRWLQPWFPPLDGMSLYAIIAEYRPAVFFEIGSGNSTKFASRAITDHHLATRIISIDPEPRTEIDSIVDQMIPQRLEEIDQSILNELSEKDVVFFDGSHRCFQNSDVTVFFLEILPQLPPGIAIGIHDIFWPSDYPEKWITRYYNEQYVLGTYMLALGRNFPLLFSCGFSGYRFAKQIRDALSEDKITDLKEHKTGLGGGALWFRKHA